jgi:membrane protease YdiL (CAAX protease family)
MNSLAILPTIVGLGLAFGGPPFIASVSERPASSGGIPTAELLSQFGLIATCTAVLAILLVWEKQSLSAIGLQPLRWQSLVWGLALTCFFVFAFSPMAFWLLQQLRLSGFDAGLSKLANLPVWYLIIAVVIGGTVEEILYRGYAVERLASLTGSYWISGLVSVLVFGLAHVPLWGWGPALTTVLSGGVLTLVYVWTKDLNANIIAHVATDFVGIVLTPLLATAK